MQRTLSCILHVRMIRYKVLPTIIVAYIARLPREMEAVCVSAKLKVTKGDHIQGEECKVHRVD